MGNYFYKYLTINSLGRYRSDYKYNVRKENEQKEGNEVIVEKDKHIYLELHKDYVRFYFYHYAEKKVNPDKENEIYCLLLDNIQHLNYDLLALPYEDKIRGNTGEYRLDFLSLLPNCLPFEVKGCSNALNLKELILAFFIEIENPESALQKHNAELCEIILTKLQASNVYQNIFLKYDLYFHLHEYVNGIDYKIDKLKSAFNIYADHIISGKLAECIPPDCMQKDNWIQTPEEEIEYLVSINNEFDLFPDKNAVFHTYFLKKHSVYQALRISSKWYKVPIIGNIIAFSAFITLFISWLLNSFEATEALIITGISAFLLSVLSILVFHKHKLDMLLPRLLIAIFTSWFIITTSEEPLVNLLSIEKVLLYICFPSILLIVFAFIFAEVRQHSPYFNFQSIKRMYWKKSITILIYAFNFSVIIGLFSHTLVVQKIIDNSNIYDGHIFKNKLDNLTNLQDYYKEYRSRLFSIQGSNMYALNFQELSSQNKTPTNINVYVDSNNISTDTFLSSQKSTSMPNINNFKIVYNKRVKAINDFNEKRLSNDVNQRKNIILKNKGNLVLGKLYSILIKHDNKKTIDSNDISIFNVNDNILNNNIIICDSLIDQINNIITKYSINKNLAQFKCKFIDKSKSETLKTDTAKIDSIYGFYNSQDSILKISFNNYIDNSQIENTPVVVYPYMLILQTLIVLIIAIIGQLIISDKTVTESL